MNIKELKVEAAALGVQSFKDGVGRFHGAWTGGGRARGPGLERHGKKIMSAPEAIAEMMSAWNKVEAAAREQFPSASDEEIYQITKGAMNEWLNLPTDN